MTAVSLTRDDHRLCEAGLGRYLGTADPGSHARLPITVDAMSPGSACGSAQSGSVDLFWLPLGAGGHFVRLNGRLYEALMSIRQHRSAQALYHSALEVRLDGRRYVIENAPVWNERTRERGVVLEGPVGAAWLGRFRAFRYEVRCWPEGRIPDVDEAVDSPLRLSEDPDRAAAALAEVRRVPALTWGRDELDAGDMWNSNSIVSWVLSRSGHDLGSVAPPAGGRAPGWPAGIVLASRQMRQSGGGVRSVAATPR